jgi:hypothetical protein
MHSIVLLLLFQSLGTVQFVPAVRKIVCVPEGLLIGAVLR